MIHNEEDNSERCPKCGYVLTATRKKLLSYMMLGSMANINGEG